MKKKSKKSPLRKLNDWLHLWLGLFSGIVVFIVAITGCIWVFQEEILNAAEPWRFVEPQEQTFLPPSRLIDIAESEMKGPRASGISYNPPDESAAVGFFHSDEDGGRAFTAVFINPYSGEVLQKQQLMGKGTFHFFEFIMDGHRALWLPYEIGRPIVGVATLIFIVLLITGIIHWWPKNWKAKNVRKVLTIKWDAKFKRLNYDLHNVLGFYTAIIALIFAITGLVMSFQWFSDGFYWMVSGGDPVEAEFHPHTDTTVAAVPRDLPGIDQAWLDCTNQGRDLVAMFVDVPRSEDDPYEFIEYHSANTFYEMDVHFYDQRTLEKLNHELPYDGLYEKAPFHEKLRLMNYDIHIGTILGMPGKILAFLVSLVIASLPITGFIIWYKPKRKADVRGRKTEDGRGTPNWKAGKK